jgi:hypothetical protein
MPFVGTGDGGMDLLAAGLREVIGPGPAVLDIALLPERCHVRWIPLPPLKHAERRAVLDRTLRRHLPGDEPWAYGVDPMPGGAVVVAASLDVVQELERALADAGFRLGSLQPAVYAWHRAVAGAPYWLVVTPSRVDLIAAPDGRIRVVRRLTKWVASEGAIRQLVQDTIPAGARSLPVLATGSEAGVVERALDGVVEIHEVSPELVPERLAAVFASRAEGPDILTPEAYDDRERMVRRLTRRLWAAAAGLALVAGAAAWGGTARELAALRTARASQGNAVATALAQRERVTRLEERFAVLDPARAGRTWSGVLSAVTEGLPATAFLSAVRAGGDSVSLEGYAREAGPVLDSLRANAVIAALRATAPIRRETIAGNVAVDRFALGLRLAPEGER